jgi:MFS superfamily sulfate permease-like transporter
MTNQNNLSPFKNLKSDIPASIVVFLVAMPLCLGIALASGAPLYSGLISGIVGGLLVGALSGSPLGVSGPAAGLAVIVLHAITDLGGFDVFLVAVVLAGILQIVMGYIKAGIIAHYFPSSVVHGMLAGIGILIFMKQIPHAFGYDKDAIGDWSFFQMDGQNTISELGHMLGFISTGALLVTIVSLAILILWDRPFMQKISFTKVIKGPLVAVTTGVILGLLFQRYTSLAISQEHLVSIPVASNMDQFLDNFIFPDFAKGLMNLDVYVTAVVLAVVASLETLLCVEASDKQDNFKRITPVNRELKAQGIGNVLCGLIGGLPVTQVIIRSSVNQQSGGKTKASAVIHGFLLLISILVIPSLLNLIPKATLAAILFVVGYKLAKPALFKKMYQQGMDQFVPFMATILGILFTNLLLGIGLGMVVAVFIILRNNYKVSYEMIEVPQKNGANKTRLILSEDVTFLNKASIQKTLNEFEDGTYLEIDATNSYFIHHDVKEIIDDFIVHAASRSMKVETVGLEDSKGLYQRRLDSSLARDVSKRTSGARLN